MSEKVVFQERQVLGRNIRMFTLVPLLLILVFLSYGFVQQVILGVPFGSNPDSDVHLIVPWLIVFLLTLFALSVHMKTKVTPSDLTVKIFPVYSRTIPLKRIVKFEPVQIQPLTDYGGWGVRYSFTNGWAYTLRGDQGVKLWLEGDEKPILIGTSRPAELQTALDMSVEVQP